MSSFDPATVREAVAAFTPARPQRFQELSAAKEVIVELRQKRASYGAIAELLTKHCLPVSKTAVAAFCHQVLGEIVRPKRRSKGRRTAAATASDGEHPTAEPVPTMRPMAVEPVPEKVPTAVVPEEDESSRPGTAAVRPRGPRIAQVRLIAPKQV